MRMVRQGNNIIYYVYNMITVKSIGTSIYIRVIHAYKSLRIVKYLWTLNHFSVIILLTVPELEKN